MMTLDQMLSGLNHLSAEELSTLNKVLIRIARVKQNLESARFAAKIRAGNRVSFVGRAGNLVTGVVTKVNMKSVKVKADVEKYVDQFSVRAPQNWTVSPSMLKVL